jgi:putative membrane protein insertion efficiency factor
MRSWPQAALIGAVRAYRFFLSPWLGSACRFEPTCSAYALESIERFGVLRGVTLAAWRLLRCNPFNHGGFDPVPERFTLRGLGHVHPADYHGEAKV